MEKYSEEWVKMTIETGREFMKMPADMDAEEDVDYYTDQDLKKPQPPLTKAPMGGKTTRLPKNFKDLAINNDILDVLYHRKSSRVYTEETMSLLELSFLIWAQQGVKEIRGKSYATIRTVACGGARHEFELYLAVKNVEGLTPGYYHYLPMEHELECIKEMDQDTETMDQEINRSLCEQSWGCKANVVFYYSVVPYRAEWRYGIWAHRTALIDAGHITQNLYVACSSLGLGTCAIAAVDTDSSDKMFLLDGVEEFIFYAAPAGHISEKDKEKEDAFYAFLKEEGL